jgi:hypothetical protein
MVFGKRRWGNKFSFFANSSPELGLVVEIVKLLHDILLSKKVIFISKDASVRKKIITDVIARALIETSPARVCLQHYKNKFKIIMTMRHVLAFLLRRLTMYVATFSETEGFPNACPVC